MRLLCSLFRARQLSLELEERLFNILHHLTDDQLDLLEQIWNMGSRLHEELSGTRR